MLDAMLPPDTDQEKLAEVALALLLLNSFGEHGAVSAWKGIPWDVMDLLHEKGWISNLVGKAKAVHLSEEAEELAARFFEKHFQK
jgi:hypothetical protein